MMSSINTDDTEPLYAVPPEVGELHRGHDGFISIVRFRPNGAPVPLPPLSAAGADQTVMPCSLVGCPDIFFSINGMATDRRPMPRSASIKWITSVAVDLDTYRVGLTPFAALDQIEPLVVSGELPPYSAAMFSGRGVWLLWFLRAGDGENETGPVRDGNNRAAYFRCCRAVHEKLAEFGSDSTARALTKFARWPGSINSKSGAVVRWSLWGDVPGRPYLYTLQQLADSLRVDATTPAPRPQNAPPKRNTDGRRNGWEVMHETRLRVLLELEAIRGGFRVGERNRALFVYAATLHALKHEEPEIERLVWEMAKRCRGRVLRSNANATARSACKKRHRLKHATISDYLDVTPAESAALGTNNKGRPLLPCAARFRGQGLPAHDGDIERLTRAQLRQARQACIARMYPKGRLPCTLRELAAQIENQLGYSAAAGTLSDDCRAVGVQPQPPVRPPRRTPPLFTGTDAL